MRSFTTVYTPYTNNSRSNYQIRTHSRYFSLFVSHSFPLPPPLSDSEKLPGSLLLARRFARARMNGDLSRRWERVRSPQDLLFRGRTPIQRRKRGRHGEEGHFSSKINTYSCDFITDGYVRGCRARIYTFVTAQRARQREYNSRYIDGEGGADHARRHPG